MVTNRDYVRKKWEDLMRNPLAKELWVTEPKNFDDPTYHPRLHLVVDSDDVTVIGDFSQFVKSNLERFGRESFNKAYKLCFEEEYDLYYEVMEFLFDLEMCDITDDLTVESSVN